MERLNCYRQLALAAGNDPYKLSKILDSMQLEYSIPLFRTSQWENDHKEVTKLYRQIAGRRNLKNVSIV